MKGINRMLACSLALWIASSCWIVLRMTGEYRQSQIHLVEMSRAQRLLEEGAALDQVRSQPWRSLRQVDLCDADAGDQELRGFFTGRGAPDSYFRILPVFGRDASLSFYARFSYRPDASWALGSLARALLACGLAFCGTTVVLLYVRQCVLKPFEAISDLPAQLARGHTDIRIPRRGHRNFEKMIWGLNMLGETLARQKKDGERLEQERHTLVASLSHSIKTPIQVIRLNAQALLLGLYPDAERRRDCLQGILSKADQVEELTCGIISAMQQEDSAPVKTECFYLSTIFDSLLQEWKVPAAAKGVRLEVRAPEDRLVRASREGLLDALGILMDNAIRYGDGEVIRVDAGERDGCGIITVENTGNSVDEEDLPLMFTRFWRGRNTGGQQGSGLGMYSCRRMMRAMGGSVFAECPNGAMRVSLVLPDFFTDGKGEPAACQYPENVL